MRRNEVEYPTFPLTVVKQYRAAQEEAQLAVEEACLSQDRARKATGALFDISARYRQALDDYATKVMDLEIEAAAKKDKNNVQTNQTHPLP